ncbi:MAG: translation initiation factor IF-2, partial [Thermodesulfobacteriota bacterium]
GPAAPGAAPVPTEGGDDGARRKRGKRVVRKPGQFDPYSVADRGGMRGGRKPLKKRAAPGKEQKRTEITTPSARKRLVRFSEVITVGDLAKAMGLKAGEVIKKLMDMGVMTTVNHVLDVDHATLVAGEFDYTVENVAFDADKEIEGPEAEAGEGEALPRDPVVTVMGHVDHGKTSLLDAIRKTNVAEGEAGGITQHIGAYTVQAKDRRITFIDTPGHAAFTAMRARGAKVTDLVILVVAADDGVMPQTIEAIAHARAAEVPIIVAVNKIDRPDADPEHVKKQLADHGLVAEDWGGDTIFAPVSAKTGDGIDHLLEMVILQADVLELKARRDTRARGSIIEAKLDRGRGPVATVLVQEGTLRGGDPFVVGVQYGRIRAMLDSQGRKVDEAGPSTPVEILGLGGVPEAGDAFVVVADEATARQVAEHRRSKQRQSEMAKSSKVSLDDLYKQLEKTTSKELRVVLKVDVQGSVDALKEAFSRLSNDEVQVSVIHASVGGVTESDVLLASASNAVIIGFNVRPEPKAAALAEREGVDVRLYTIIYDAINQVREALEGLLEPTTRERTVGRAEVRQTFGVGGAGVIAGSSVTDGKIVRGALARLLRDHAVVHQGKIASLRRFKDDVREVAAGYECGIGLDNFNDVKPGDVIEVYELEQVARRIQPTPGAEKAQSIERYA